MARMRVIDGVTDRVSFNVVGHPEPGGSKRAFSNRKTGKAWVTDDNPKAKPWQATVASAAYDAMHAGDTALLEGPLGLSVIFTRCRPKGHFGTRGLRPSAPEWPTTKPDCTKLLRAVEDALTGVVWRDDAQVVEQSVTKRYGAPEGAHVCIWRV